MSRCDSGAGLDEKDIVDVINGLDDIRQLFARKYTEITERKWDART